MTQRNQWLKKTVNGESECNAFIRQMAEAVHKGTALPINSFFVSVN
jgi:hypothetical protein